MGIIDHNNKQFLPYFIYFGAVVTHVASAAVTVTFLFSITVLANERLLVDFVSLLTVMPHL